MEEDADETTDREIESYLKKLEWAGIEINRPRYLNNDLQRTTASDVQASAAIITPISSPESVPCSPDKAFAISRRRQAVLPRRVGSGSLAKIHREAVGPCHKLLAMVMLPSSTV
jgi:hypothetical protein